MVERIAQTLPTAMDISERLDFQNDADAAVPCALVATAEEPAIHFLALGATGRDHFGNTRLGMLDQITQQP